MKRFFKVLFLICIPISCTLITFKFHNTIDSIFNFEDNRKKEENKIKIENHRNKIENQINQITYNNYYIGNNEALIQLDNNQQKEVISFIDNEIVRKELEKNKIVKYFEAKAILFFQNKNYKESIKFFTIAFQMSDNDYLIAKNLSFALLSFSNETKNEEKINILYEALIRYNQYEKSNQAELILKAGILRELGKTLFEIDKFKSAQIKLCEAREIYLNLERERKPLNIKYLQNTEKRLSETIYKLNIEKHCLKNGFCCNGIEK